MTDFLSSLRTLFIQGGWVMVPLLACSLLALAVVIDRLLSGPSRKRLFPKALLESIEELLEKQRYEELLGVCRHQSTALSQILTAALQSRDKRREEMIRQVEIAGQRQAIRLQRRLGILGTIAAITPLLGLLGTVFGMISTFEVIQSEGVGNANALAGGFSEALITTATGLSIAIPSLVFYRAFQHHTKNLIAELEQVVTLLIERIPSHETPINRTEQE